MPRNTSAIAALKKLEADRESLESKRRELEEEAARELGRVILGSGLESFSKKGLRRTAEILGKLGETAALQRLSADKPEAGKVTSQGTG